MVGSSRTLILPNARFDGAAIRRDLALMVAFSMLTAASARVVIPLPFTPVPITGQTFGVLLTGALLGGWRAFGAMLLYVGEGLLGLPVFAGGAISHPGLTPLLGRSGGYLIAFPFAALVVGLLAERGWDRTFARALAAMVVGSALVYLIGAGWLSRWVGPIGAIHQGILPFLLGDALKATMAAALLPLGWRYIGRGER